MLSTRRQQALWTLFALVLVGLAVRWWPQTSPQLNKQAAEASSSISSAASSFEQAPAANAQLGGDTGAATNPWTAAAPSAAAPRVGMVPATLELALLQASLSALQGNGANLSAPMRSRHVVQVTDPRTADELTRWGRQQGFTMSSDRFYLHGGIEAQMLYFDKYVVPDAQRIQLDGLSILQALTGMDTAEYGTWMGEINRR